MDSKPLAAIILAKSKPSKDVDDKPELGESSTSDMGLDSAVDDIFDAIEAKNKTKFKEALKSAINLCGDDDSDIGPEEK